MPTEPPYGSAVGIPPPPDAAFIASANSRAAAGSPRRKRGLRLAFVVPVILTAAVVAYLVGSKENDNGLGSLRPGDCIASPDVPELTKIDKIDCDKQHTKEVYAVGSTSRTITTGGDALTDPEIIRICRIDVDPRILRVLGNTAGVDAGFLVDSDKTGTVVCTAISTTPRTGSLVDQANS